MNIFLKSLITSYLLTFTVSFKKENAVTGFHTRSVGRSARFALPPTCMQYDSCFCMKTCLKEGGGSGVMRSCVLTSTLLRVFRLRAYHVLVLVCLGFVRLCTWVVMESVDCLKHCLEHGGGS